MNIGENIVEIDPPYFFSKRRIVLKLLLGMKVISVFPWLKINVYTILNDFYGHGITVTGLLVGNDIISQLKGKDLGERLYIPENCVRSGSDEFLDDVRLPGLEDALQCSASIVKSSGRDFCLAMLGIRI